MNEYFKPHKQNFIEQYLHYIGETEAPQVYHRWCAISILATWLARDVTIQLGHFNLVPNMYIMLMGTSGTRKSTAIKIAKKLLKNVGYSYFAPEKSTKEKFLIDLSEQHSLNAEDLLDSNLWGGLNGQDYQAGDAISQMLISADEFNDFIGNGNIEFISLLGSLWDFHGPYDNKVKNSKSVSIPNPTVNILAGNTPTSFAMAFPADTMGQGFFSRLLLIHGEPTGKRITFPEPPSHQLTENLLKILGEIKSSCRGYLTITPPAEKMLDEIYQNGRSVIDDIRFESYSSRRFSHLLKLIIVVTASRVDMSVTPEDVMYANTILTHVEYLMPRALGQFGRSKNSGLAHRMLQVVEAGSGPISSTELWTQLLLEFDTQNQMTDLLRNMILAGRLQTTKGGFLPVKTVLPREELEKSGLVDFSILTNEERSMAK